MSELIDQIGPRVFVTFLKANGLDANDVPARGSVQIIGNDVIRFRNYQKLPNGDWIAGPDGRALLTGWRTTPLRVAPEGVTSGRQ